MSANYPECDAAEIRTLRLALAAAYAVIDLDNAVCLCGCPGAEHETVDEGAEQCEHEDHECIRVAPAVLEIVGRVRRERDAALARLAAPPSDAATEAVRYWTFQTEWGDGYRPAAVLFQTERIASLVREQSVRLELNVGPVIAIDVPLAALSTPAAAATKEDKT